MVWNIPVRGTVHFLRKYVSGNDLVFLLWKYIHSRLGGLERERTTIYTFYLSVLGSELEGGDVSSNTWKQHIQLFDEKSLYDMIKLDSLCHQYNSSTTNPLGCLSVGLFVRTLERAGRKTEGYEGFWTVLGEPHRMRGPLTRLKIEYWTKSRTRLTMTNIFENNLFWFISFW